MSILIIGSVSSGKSTYLKSLIGMIQRRNEQITRAISARIFLDDVEVSISSILYRLEDDETRIKRIEKEFFADIQKLYGDYRRYGIDVNAQLEHKYKDFSEQFEQKTSQRFELNELHNQVQECRNIFATIIRYRFHLILEKILRSKGEVRQKPPLISSLKFIFILIKNQFLILQRFFDIQWIELNNLQRTSWGKKLRKRPSICQQIIIGNEIERYMQNRIHPDKMMCYQ